MNRFRKLARELDAFDGNMVTLTRLVEAFALAVKAFQFQRPRFLWVAGPLAVGLRNEYRPWRETGRRRDGAVFVGFGLLLLAVSVRWR